MKPDAKHTLSMLRNAIILAVENFFMNIIPQIRKHAFYRFPCFSTIMINNSLYIFKNKNLRLTLFYHACIFIKKSASCVFKTKSFTNHRKSLTWSTSNKQIDLI